MRQVERKRLFEKAMGAVNAANLQIVVDEFNRPTGVIRGMKRKDRRALARAYAAGAWGKRAVHTKV